jgi:hypothetical protein
VILALGMVSIDEVASNLEGKIPTVFKIGDAYRPAGFTEAIESGFKIGFQILSFYGFLKKTISICMF